ncbi:MAG: response regulator [Bacteroidetes bacterium]|jgi:response regulator RpfG family c-di-GMP phosphodiesterase|nr:response regulator [Bacteroidota bacterium]
MEKPTILMLEPDDADRFITRIFFKDHNFDADLHFVNTSGEFFDFLNSTDKIPSIILLNMHAVPVDAPGILQKLKSSKEWAHIPVIILSGSKDARLIKECYSYGASSCIQKPDNEPETNHKILNFIKYWFETVELP